MPNLDGGHYFFTALLPINNHALFEHGGIKSSPVHMVRDALEALPTALQSPASVEIGIQSPFARSLRTHFVRLFVIDQPYFNGRDPEDSLESAIFGTDLLKAQPVDRLACPYLAFVAEFDPLQRGAGEPRAWLEDLWTLAPAELGSVFSHCYGYAPGGDAAAFAGFVLKGQVETTMPFNDYWTIAPPFPSLALWQLAIPPVLSILVTIGAGMTLQWPAWANLLLGAGLFVSSIWVDYAWVMASGTRPLPTAPNSTLRDVLKALFLQQAFARFAAQHQGASPAELRAAFAEFAARVRPDDVAGPTQAPGVIRADLAAEGVDA